MKCLGLVLFAALLSFAQTPTTPQPQFTEVPPKPTCNPNALPLFGGGPDCQDRWNLYNQALQKRQNELLQFYVNRQKDLATAPLQQQIADLNKLVSDQQSQIKKLNDQMQADAASAIQAKTDAHKSGFQSGIVTGAIAMVVLFGLVFGIRRLKAPR